MAVDDYGIEALKKAAEQDALSSNPAADYNLKVRVAAPLPTGGNTIGIVDQGEPNTTAKSWPIKLTDGTLVNTIKPLSTQVVSSDNGLVTNTVIHGLTTGGGGGYVDVKVNPSGALTVEATQSGTYNVRVLANTGGVIQNQTVTVTASTFSVPANAVGFILEAESTNTDKIRWAVGSTATASIGTLMEPGRDTGYIPMAVNISVISLSGSQLASVQWILSQ